MLNHAAALLESRPVRRLAVAVPLRLAPAVVSAALLTTLLALFTMASSASALEGIDLGEPAAPAAEGECPRLVQIKYPFLSCAAGQIGQSAADETWESSRRIPMASDFVEGNGYWGDELNSD